MGAVGGVGAVGSVGAVGGVEGSQGKRWSLCCPWDKEELLLSKALVQSQVDGCR